MDNLGDHLPFGSRGRMNVRPGKLPSSLRRVERPQRAHPDPRKAIVPRTVAFVKGSEHEWGDFVFEALFWEELKPIFLALAPKGGPAHAGKPGRLFQVSAGNLQGLADQFRFIEPPGTLDQ